MCFKKRAKKKRVTFAENISEEATFNSENVVTEIFRDLQFGAVAFSRREQEKKTHPRGILKKRRTL